MCMEHWRNDIAKESRNGRRKTWLSVTFCTAKLTCDGLIKKRSVRGERPTSNLMGRGAAYMLKLSWILIIDPVHTAQWTHSITCYKNQSVYAVSGTSRCLFWDPYKTHKHSVSTMKNFWMLTLVLRKVNGRLYRAKNTFIFNIPCSVKLIM